MKLLKNSVFALLVSSCCLMQSVMVEGNAKEANKIRQYLYNSNVDFNSFSSEDIAYYKSIIEDHMITLQQKSGVGYNAIQGTILAGCAVRSVCSACNVILLFFPYNIMVQSMETGLAYAIKDAIKENLVVSVLCITPPLILAALSYKCFSKDWNNQKSLKAALLRDELVLERLEKAEQQK